MGRAFAVLTDYTSREARRLARRAEDADRRIDFCDRGRARWSIAEPSPYLSMSRTKPSEAEADRMFAALADGGQVQMPLAKTFFARFGMVADRFGVGWMIIVEP